MTTLALNYSQNLLSGIWSFLRKTLEGMMIGWMLARQNQANYHIARQMLHEYREETLDSLHHKLNTQSLERISKEFSK